MNRLQPAPVPRLGRASTIAAAGAAATCAVVKGEVWCWGRMSIFGYNAPDRHVPRRIRGLVNVAQLSINRSSACARTIKGRVLCWGAYFSGRRPHPVTNLTPSKKVSVGVGFACSIGTNKRVACWGHNGSGGLGFVPAAGSRGKSRKRKSVAQALRASLVPDLDDVIDLAVGSAHACAVRRSGEVLCWGGRSYQYDHEFVGFGETSRPPVLIHDGRKHRIKGINDAMAVNADGTSSCALRRTGVMACWTYGSSKETRLVGPTTCPNTQRSARLSDHGQHVVLSNGKIINVFSGTLQRRRDGFWAAVCEGRPIKGISDAVEAGSYCVLRKDGRVVCWGTNEHGQLGRPRVPLFKR